MHAVIPLKLQAILRMLPKCMWRPPNRTPAQGPRRPERTEKKLERCDHCVSENIVLGASTVLRRQSRPLMFDFTDKHLIDLHLVKSTPVASLPILPRAAPQESKALRTHTNHRLATTSNRVMTA